MAASSTFKQPHWLDKPEEVEIPYIRIVLGPFGTEAAVEIKLNGTTQQANVPISAVDQKLKTVKGLLTARVDDSYVLVTFQPTSLGATVLRIKASLLKQAVSK